MFLIIGAAVGERLSRPTARHRAFACTPQAYSAKHPLAMTTDSVAFSMIAMWRSLHPTTPQRLGR